MSLDSDAVALGRPQVPAQRPHARDGMVGGAPRGRRRSDASALVSPRTPVADLIVTFSGVGLGLVIGSTLIITRSSWSGPGGPAMVLGTFAAMTGTYLCMLLMLLVSRLPWLEREVGQDRLVRWHRQVAPYSLLLITAHVILTTLGFAQSAKSSFTHEFAALVTQYGWMVPATVSFAVMVLLGISSYRWLRERLKYETWWTAHLYFYIAVVLGFGHQITLGFVFGPHPLIRHAWAAFYVAVFAAIAAGRIGLPVYLSVRHRIRVDRVEVDAPDMVSVYLTGRHLSKLHAAGGQYFQWRFLTRHWWWQAHPYSLSAAPRDNMMRITVKALGDQSGALWADLTPGTRVAIEGPYGVFTARARRSERVIAIAAGVGITPIRAMLDDLPRQTDVTVIYRVSSTDNAPLADELEKLASESGWHIHVLAGHRDQHPLTAQHISQYVTDLVDADIYVCGPAEFTDAVLDLARHAGVPEKRIHHEEFSF